MSKKDFNEVAGIILAMDVGKSIRHLIAVEFAQAFFNTHEGFDRGRFIQAATTGNLLCKES